MKFFGKFILWCTSIGLLGLIAGIVVIIAVFHHYSQNLPDHSFLKDYEPPVVTRVHSGDGRLLAEFAQEKRIYIPIEEIPERVKNAFIAAEDQNFYKHAGVDLTAVLRAIVINLKNYGKDKRKVGGSTITQQVAKNFLLSSERKYERKIKEAILSYRIDKAMSKDRILELYLNEIFFGNRSYGIGAASINYFNKPLDQLSIAEAAYLGGLPKAPSDYHPTRNYDKAMRRRNWVITRMMKEGFITAAQAELARLSPLETKKRDKGHIVKAPYFAEEVRRKMIEAYGSDSIYKKGLSIRTSVNPTYQDIAIKALRGGLSAYDRRHGYRGPVKKSANTSTLKDVKIQQGMLKTWELALVKDSSGKIVTQGDVDGEINSKDIKWANRSHALKSGNVVMVEKTELGKYALKQVPKIQGAIIVMDPHAGRILAMQGGWTFDKSEYNRATQAKRQPGSAFKPFVYLAALESGLTPSTRVLDAPFEYEDRPGNIWKPKNYSNKYFGPTPLRVGVEKSKNLMTVRLAHHIGMDRIVDVAKRFNIDQDMKPLLANSLGSGEVTLINMTAAYAMLVNGGKKIAPTFIDRIQDRYGKTIFKYDNRACKDCGDFINWEHQGVPTIPDQRTSVSNPQNVYQIVSILEGVVERGTARRLKSLNRPLAGKTGTTNDSKDAWFIGFSPDLVVGVYTGFDNPKSLGKKETGSSVAVPIFKSFMEEALKGVPATPFRVPSGMRQIRVNPKTGYRVSPLDKNGIWEAFVPGTSPETSTLIIEGGHPEDMEKNGIMIDEFSGEIIEQSNPYYNNDNVPYSYGDQPNTQNGSSDTGTGGLY